MDSRREPSSLLARRLPSKPTTVKDDECLFRSWAINRGDAAGRLKLLESNVGIYERILPEIFNTAPVASWPANCADVLPGWTVATVTSICRNVYQTIVNTSPDLGGLCLSTTM
jgi:hypothetical protein